MNAQRVKCHRSVHQNRPVGRIGSTQRARRATPWIVSATNPAVLVGDIGGTNARLSLWSVGAGLADRQEIFSKTYSTKGHSTFELCLREFFADAPRDAPKPESGALAVAGPVANNTCRMTNTNWVIDGGFLSSEFDFKVAVLNDFEAVGYGIPVLGPQDLEVINRAPVVEKAPKIVMGPGTGLGAAQLMWDDLKNDYKVWPGEGAHATFAPRGWKQKALAQFVERKLGHTEIEYIACGSGLELIYEFLLSDEVFNRPDVLPATRKTDKEITRDALEGKDPLAVETVDIFLAIIGAEAGNMALRCLARGGVYMAGGIAPRLLKRIMSGGMLEAFLNRKVRPNFHELLVNTPFFVVKNDQVGVIGCREYAVSLFKGPSK